MPPIKFWFDFVSPYAYLAWTQVHALAERHDRRVEAVPVLFAALLDAHGSKGPAEIPAKLAYVWKDVVRHADMLKVPLTPPPSHPFNPLLALRAGGGPMPDEARKALINGLFAATWGRGEGVTDPAVVARIADEAGLDGARVIEDAQSEEAKARLREATREAIELGVFGVPSLLVDGELFWGLDSLAHVERRLRGVDPITPERLAQFRRLRPSALRPAAKRS